MLYIVWAEKNHLGIPIIDEQHRGVVSTINSLHYFTWHGEGVKAIKPTLGMLEQYTFVHFETEEELMRKAGYPYFKDHELLHKKLMARTVEIARQSVSWKDSEIVLSFLKEWWLRHINIEDRKYAPHVRTHLGI